MAEEQNKGQERQQEAREAAQERREQQGKDAKAFGRGGNPDEKDEETTEE